MAVELLVDGVFLLADGVEEEMDEVDAVLGFYAGGGGLLRVCAMAAQGKRREEQGAEAELQHAAMLVES